MTPMTFSRFALPNILLLSALTVVTFGQSDPPTEGYRLSSPNALYDVIMPLTVTQCEPVSIYYNIASEPSMYGVLELTTADPSQQTLVVFEFPSPTGYLEWICDIPAGYSFIAWADLRQFYTVHPGPSSDCLGNITATYSDLIYETIPFRLYTELAPTLSFTDPPQQSTVAFPTGTFETLTANPPADTTTSVQTSPPSPTSHPRKSNDSAVIGGAVGGVVIAILIAVTVIFIFQQKRKRSRPVITIATSPTTKGPPTATRPSMKPIVPSTLPELTGDMPATNQFRPRYVGPPVPNPPSFNTRTNVPGRTAYRDGPLPASMPPAGTAPREYADIPNVLGAVTRLSPQGRHVSNILTSNTSVPSDEKKGDTSYLPPSYGGV